MTMINSLVEERTEILIDEKVSRDQEIDWLSKALARLEKAEAFYMAAQGGRQSCRELGDRQEG